MHRLLLIVALAAALSGGLLGHPAQGGQTVGDDTELFHERWQSFHIAHYRYSLVVVCECGLAHQPYTMEVRDGHLISAVNAAGQAISDADISAPPQSVDWFYSLTTLDTLFDHLHEVSAQGTTVNIIYDPQYAFPAYAFVSWISGQPEAEVALHVFDFEVMP